MVERARAAFLGLRRQETLLEEALGLRAPDPEVAETDIHEQVQRYGETEFQWNNRTCHGTQIHLAALGGDVPEVLRLLSLGHPITQAFGYIQDSPDGKEQLCEGQAIHLAASRGHQEMVEELLERKADINSMLFRDNLPHYDVLHAAVFKEGRGGASEGDLQLIPFLCKKGADIFSKNGNDLSCMHLAFQTGDLKTIKLVEQQIWEKVKESNENRNQILSTNSETSLVSENSDILDKASKLLALADLEEVDFLDPSRSDAEKTPLEIGIKYRKMDKETLADAAPKGMGSLRVFIHEAPECIPLFMEQLTREDRAISEVLANKISSRDIAKLLREFPEAAASVLETVTTAPYVECEGWHPLPARVSFASSLWLVNGPLSALIQPSRFRCFYERENEWGFNARKYQAPPWHDKLESCQAPPVYDAKIQVCSIPNIINPNFFSAVLDASEGIYPAEPALFLFQCVPIRAAVSYTFWNGAIWVDLAQFLVSFWGLCLLLVETFLAHEAATDQEMLQSQIARVYEPSFITETYKMGVVADWIIAKGIVDLLLEVAQFMGCVVIGEPQCYFRLGNVWDLMRSVIPILLLWHYEKRILQTLIVLIYWMRLLEGVTYSERIGHALLPLHKLASGLMPAMSFTLVGFCTLSHAMYTVQLSPQHLWPDHFYHTFLRLITQSLPTDVPEDMLELVLLYLGVLFFSIFVMNIFIGVISEQYSNQKQHVGLMFQSLRASSCLLYLLRMCVIPCNLLSYNCAALIASAVVLVTLALQVASLGFSRQLPYLLQLMAFVVCQLVIFMASIQCRGSDYPWETFSFCSGCEYKLGRSYSRIPTTPRSQERAEFRRAEKRYLWICEPRNSEKSAWLQSFHHKECPKCDRRASTASLLVESSQTEHVDAMLQQIREAVGETVRQEMGRGTSRDSTRCSTKSAPETGAAERVYHDPPLSTSPNPSPQQGGFTTLLQHRFATRRRVQDGRQHFSRLRPADERQWPS